MGNTDTERIFSLSVTSHADLLGLDVVVYSLYHYSQGTFPFPRGSTGCCTALVHPQTQRHQLFGVNAAHPPTDETEPVILGPCNQHV